MKTQRINWIDSSKGIAILLFLFQVSLKKAAEIGKYESGMGFLNNVSGWLSIIIFPVLMILSGYLFALNCMPDRFSVDTDKIHSKVKNLFLFYIIFQFLYLLLRIIISPIASTGMSISGFVSELCFPSSGMWYIEVVLVYYLLNLLFNFGRLSPVLVLGIFGIGSLVLGFLVKEWSVSYSINEFFILIPYFEAGKILRWHSPDQKRKELFPKIKNKNLIYFIVLVILSLINMIFIHDNAILNFAISVLVSVLFIKIIANKANGRSILNSIGELSLPIYALHIYIVFLLSRLFATFINIGFINAVLTFLFSVVILFFLAVLSLRIPFLKKLFHPIDFIKKKYYLE